jgi:hypothetical protein
MNKKYKIFSIEELVGDRNKINDELQTRFPQVDIVVPGILDMMPDYLRALAQRVAEGTIENKYIAYSPEKLIVPNKKEVSLYSRKGTQLSSVVSAPQMDFRIDAEIEKAGFLKVEDIDDEVNGAFGYNNLLMAARIYAMGISNPTQELDPRACLSIIYLKNMRVEPIQKTTKK